MNDDKNSNNHNENQLLSMPRADLPSDGDDNSSAENGEMMLDETQAQELATEIEKLKAQLRDELIALVQHPATPEFFKSHPVVKEMIE
jgi:hypothetical protein